MCKMWFIIAVFLFNASVLSTGKINYCGSKMCSHTNAHTFCQFSDRPGPQCKGFMEALLSDEEKMRILIRLNQRRAATAAGRLKRFPGASNMMKLTWVDELAREAQLWANQCEPPSTPEGHDACRDLYSVSVGQCVASVVGEAPGLRPESMVDLWYMQNMFYKGNVSYYIPPSNNQLSYYGDFAQLLYAQAYMVGCGRSRFMVSSSGRMRSVERLVCNIAPRGPGAGRAIWAVGGAGTGCPARAIPDAHTPALCTFQRGLDESVDQDNLMSLEAHILLDTIFEIEKNKSLNYVGSIDEIYLTKVAVVAMKDIVPVQDNNGVQKRNVYNSDTPNNENKYDLESNDHSVLRIIETTDVTPPKSTITTVSLQKVKLIGRPKSYNMDDLNDNNDYIEAKTDNPQVHAHESLLRETELGLDYEFTDETEGSPPPEHYRKTPSSTNIVFTMITELTTSTPVPTVMPSTATTQTNATEMIVYLSTSSEAPLGTSVLFTSLPLSSEIDKINISENVTLNTSDTDALLEEYLNDPEMVKKLQEELERIEHKAASTLSQLQPSTIFLDQTERAEKVRRAINEQPHEEQVYDRPDGEAFRNISDLRHFDPVPREMQGMYRNPAEQRNKSFDPPLLDIAKKYLPFLNQYKTGVFSSNNRAVYSKNAAIFVVVLVPTLLASLVF